MKRAICVCFTLQQIAQQQFEGETLDSSVISALTGVEEDPSMEPTDTVNPEIVASTEVESITNVESIDSSEVIDQENLWPKTSLNEPAHEIMVLIT